ncbi:MAG: hypothetical protein IPG72_03505 [Ardenticatenales bacterium]|nr:hypothetical protein [Ardenticatenales bacterium]
MFARLTDQRRRAVPLALVIALGACKAGPSPVSTTVRPTPVPTRTAIPSHTVSVAGVHIAVPDALGATVEAIEVPAELDIVQPLAGGVRFTLIDYPIRRLPAATIEVRRGPVDPVAGAQIKRRFLEMFKFILERDPKAPYVPIFARPGVREQFVAQLTFRGIGLGSGRGARAVTQLGRTIRPINNQDLVYVFEGLIRNNAVWVSMIAPVTVNDAAIAADATMADPAAFAQDYTAYLAKTVERLNALPSDAFTPNLDHLDAVAKSVRLDWPTPSPDEFATADAIRP